MSTNEPTNPETAGCYILIYQKFPHSHQSTIIRSVWACEGHNFSVFGRIGASSQHPKVVPEGWVCMKKWGASKSLLKCLISIGTRHHSGVCERRWHLPWTTKNPQWPWTASLSLWHHLIRPHHSAAVVVVVVVSNMVDFVGFLLHAILLILVALLEKVVFTCCCIIFVWLDNARC